MAGTSGVPVAARHLAPVPHPAVDIPEGRSVHLRARARAEWDRRLYHYIRVTAWGARALPRPSAVPVSRALAMAVLASPRSARYRHFAAIHQSRARGMVLEGGARKEAVREAFASYARYWMESLRLPVMGPEEVDPTFTIEGLEHIRAAREAGTGAILALPHVGGWEVGGSWLVRQGFPLTVVVEALKPPELFGWFADLRRSQGFTVIPLSRAAGMSVVRALRANQIVALVSDRDITGGGVEVEFFGERTTLPAGPATLASRFGAPLLPTAVYFDGPGHHAVVRPAVPSGGDVAAITQTLAHQLEDLIRGAPEQWHLFQPNWPSDRL
ncbi:MAG TPA: phosphatidylinositol mannoside acyltransferase [Acidimicrobiales bacterium]|nr:phosphatidylinositol mannoside acyltransferase [Acidimicrobiales bacterium]